MSEVIGATIAILIVIGGLLLVIINQISDHWMALRKELSDIQSGMRDIEERISDVAHNTDRIASSSREY